MTGPARGMADVQFRYCMLLMMLLVALWTGGIAGVFGPMGQDLAITALAVAVVGGLIILIRQDSLLKRSDGRFRFCGAWFQRSEPVIAAVPTESQADRLAKALDRAQKSEDDTADLYRLARCAAEEVVRARAIRLQAEIALMRYQMTQLQYSYRR